MPYIPEKDRPSLDPEINALAEKIVKVHKEYGYDGAFAGLLNYSVTRVICLILLKAFERPRYFHSPLIRGTLKDIGDELYRRVFVEYEEIQTEKNGDVPEYTELRKLLK